MHEDDRELPAKRTRWRFARLTSPAGLILAGLCLLLPFMSASCAGEGQAGKGQAAGGQAAEGQAGAQWRITYTGVDVVAGGAPRVEFTEDAGTAPLRQLDDAEVGQALDGSPGSLPAQPVAWLAVALMAAALGATALRPTMWRTTAAAGLALASAVVLGGAGMLARRDAVDAVSAVVGQGMFSRTVAPEGAQGDYSGQINDLFRYEYGFWIAVALLAAVGVAGAVRLVRDPALERETPAA